MKNKWDWADNVRFAAILSVIVLHVASTGAYLYGQNPMSHWMIANIVDSAVRCSVPLFLMLSGALLLGNKETAKTFYAKRFTRVVIPFLFWSIIYTIIYVVFFLLKGKDVSFSECVYNFVLCRGFFSQFAYHLWYVYVLLGIYLLTPIFNRFISIKKSILLPVFLICWIAAITLQIATYDKGGFINYGAKFAGYIGYYFAGFFISQIKLKNNVPNKIILSAISFALILFTALTTYKLSTEQNNLVTYYYNFLSPNTIIYSISTFLLLKTISISNAKIISVRNFINEYSFGIYLIHVLFLWGFEMTGFDWNFIHPLIGIPISSVALLMVSTVFVWAMRKNSILKMFVG